MAPTLLRTALLLLLSGPVLAQPVPGAGTQPRPAIQTPQHRTTAKPPATKPPAIKPPLVRPRPGAAAQHRPPVPAPPPPASPPPEPEKPPEPTKGSNTGNPLPRFATLRSDEVNLRTGPGTRYPIDWVYKRRDLPVLIEREFEVWRLIRDPEGVKGWVHQATLAPRRTGVVLAGAATEPVLRSDPRESAASIARLKPGVIVRLRSCEATSDWCQAQVQDYRGWIKRSDIWGTFPGEVIQ